MPKFTQFGSVRVKFESISVLFLSAILQILFNYGDTAITNRQGYCSHLRYLIFFILPFLSLCLMCFSVNFYKVSHPFLNENWFLLLSYEFHHPNNSLKNKKLKHLLELPTNIDQHSLQWILVEHKLQYQNRHWYPYKYMKNNF